MMSFGLVTEGESDQVVIESILFGYFNDPNLEVIMNHPLRDATDQGRATGGWGNLREYCGSSKFRKTFETVNYVILQIDTDVSEEYGVSHREADFELTTEALVERTVSKLIEWIGPEVYELARDRIIFAIAVHQIECWMLPIYFNDKKRGKTSGCLNALNQVLPKREGFSIHAKEYRYYERMSKHFLKRKDLDRYTPHNPSLKIFVEALERCQP